MHKSFVSSSVWLVLFSWMLLMPKAAYSHAPTPTSLPTKKHHAHTAQAKPPSTAMARPEARVLLKAVDTRPLPSSLPVIPEGSVVQDILSSKTLRICTRSDIPPFAYFRGTQLVGMDIELARELVTWFSIRYKTSLRAHWVVIRAADRISYLQQSLCDIVIATFSKNAARAKQIAFSSVYFRTQKAVLVRRHVGEAPLVGLVRGATAPQTAFKGASFAYFYSYSDIAYAMKRTMLDYVVADAPTARYMLRVAGKGYRVERRLAQNEEYAIGLHHRHHFLRRELDLALSQLEQQGRLGLLKRRWTR